MKIEISFWIKENSIELLSKFPHLLQILRTDEISGKIFAIYRIFTKNFPLFQMKSLKLHSSFDITTIFFTYTLLSGDESTSC